MKRKEKIIIAWSGGKDAALALYKLQRAYRYEAVALLANVNEKTQRINGHEIPYQLIEAQAASLGIPAYAALMPPYPSNEIYEQRLEEGLAQCRTGGINQIAYGDLFLEDIRAYRDAHLKRIGMKGIYPLWGRDTVGLAREFIDSGFKAIVTCVDLTRLNDSFLGREYSTRFLSDLPDHIDPCGENGEFHTFVYDGPNLSQRVDFVLNDPYVIGDRWAYCDIEDSLG